MDLYLCHPVTVVMITLLPYMAAINFIGLMVNYKKQDVLMASCEFCILFEKVKPLFSLRYIKSISVNFDENNKE